MYNRLLKIILTIYISITFMSSFASASINTPPYNILIINSYDSQNQWEHLIFEGLRDALASSYNVEFEVEFLDSKNSFSDDYIKGFSEFINLKYKDTKIDAVLTLDDEAFFVVRNNIFNENSLFYKKPTIFLGVNNPVVLNELEKEYITGIIEMEDNLRLLNMLVAVQPSLDEIFLLFDDSIFSQVVKDNIKSINLLVNNSPKLNYIEEDYIEHILPKIQFESDPQDKAILLIGDFKSINTNNFISLEQTLSLLQQEFNIPIYSKIEPYILAGAIGGIVDIAHHHSHIAASILVKLIDGGNISDIALIHNSLDLTLFNYKALNKYNINPFLLPKESIIINRNMFDFLLPYPLKIIAWALIALGFFMIIFLIWLYFKKRRQRLIAEALYTKALETEKFKNDFITTMSHEFRTPINIILSTCHLLTMVMDKNKFEPDYIKQRLSYISQNSNRLLKLVNNIIDITKLESNIFTLNLSHENIVEVVENTVLSIIDWIKSKNINLIFDTEEEEIYTTIDKSKIERCILNLLSNCIKFTPNEGNITVHIKRKENNIVIDIEDTGIGIPKDQLPFIFDRFHQVNTPLIRDSEGSGLGLFIVKGLISLHNGTIVVQSTLGKGSIFSIILPINESTDKNYYQINDDTLSDLVKIELSDIN